LLVAVALLGSWPNRVICPKSELLGVSEVAVVAQELAPEPTSRPSCLALVPLCEPQARDHTDYGSRWIASRRQAAHCWSGRVERRTLGMIVGSEHRPHRLRRFVRF